MNSSFEQVFELARSEAAAMLHGLHFLRPEWFYALIPLLIYLVYLLNRPVEQGPWKTVVDNRLAPFVLTRGKHKPRRLPWWLVLTGASLGIVALAGPSYEKLPQPVFREQSSLVILLDLSQSMDATDIRPSRLERAKLELLDILDYRKTGQTALIVYAADAFVVTPLTDDTDTIKNLVPALDTAMMPAQGSNFSIALAKAFSLLSQSGIVHGNILALTDDIHTRDLAAIEKVSAQGHRLSIFGFGTVQGAPIPLTGEGTQGGFLLDSNGAIVIPKLDRTRLMEYASEGNGRYISLQADDTDTKFITQLMQTSSIRHKPEDEQRETDLWRDDGYWLLLPVMLIAMFWARRGWLAVLILALSHPGQPGYAATREDSINNPSAFSNFWLTPDQQAMQAFEQGHHAQAANQFTRPEWQASAYYRDGDYARAAELLKDIDDSNAQYNRGNALARMGQYQQALQAYDRALELSPDNADAQHNRELVKQALQQQKQNNAQENQDQAQQDSSQQDDEQQSQQQNPSQNSQSEQQQASEKSEQQQQQDQQAETDDESKASKPSQQAQQAEDNQQQAGNEQSNDQQQNESSADSSQAMNEQQQQEQQNQQLSQRDAEQEKTQEDAERAQYQQSQNAEAPEPADDLDDDRKPQEVQVNPVDARVNEQELATRQWLKRIPDDPAGLLRRKFLYQYKHNANRNPTEQPW
jgi:Ca-activated chloride channel family protein